MSGYESLRWEPDGPVVRITLDRPHKKNAMSWTMFEEIGAVFRRAADDDDVRCVVLTGAGDAFCSGADLSDPANLVSGRADADERMATINEIALSVFACPKPTIARVAGIAAGAGCNLALGCDLVVAGRDAAFAELFVKRGLVVDFGGLWILSRALPLAKAKELALLGDTVDAAEAHRIGLVNRLCDNIDELDRVVAELAGRLAAAVPDAVRAIKAGLNDASARSLPENLAVEAEDQAARLTSPDTIAALAQWLQRRAEGRAAP
ncbi:MAG: enoyl-CoA hydratase/isomerase family protein [Actinomycetota bacterium]